MSKTNNWTREETIIAFNVYCKIPFKSSNKNHPTIIEFAKILGRSPSALNMKIGNFGRLDPQLKSQGISGLAHGSKLEEEIWKEFNEDWNKLAYESELLISKFSQENIEERLQIEHNEFEEGFDRETTVKQRVNQSFFRSTVLSSYYSKCCITGLSIPELLIASHIIPWSIDKKNRLNPHNGLCLNPIHDKAFDKGFLTITSDFKVKVSETVMQFDHDPGVKKLLLRYNGIKISLPDKFQPSREFLDFHYNHIFKK